MYLERRVMLEKVGIRDHLDLQESLAQQVHLGEEDNWGLQAKRVVKVKKEQRESVELKDQLERQGLWGRKDPPENLDPKV